MNNLLTMLNEIDFDDDLSLSDLFVHFDVSYFTHCLNSDEYLNESLVCFSDIDDDPEKEEVFKSIEGKFFCLYSDLYKLTNGHVSLILNGTAYEYVDFSDYSKALSLSLRENPLYNFYFHNINLYVMSGCDLTHCFYLQKGNDAFVTTIMSSIENAGLHII